ncbi:uncharacterized protein B0T15DRAFT_530475 [Chaetomium strumarium]|uniref:Nuclear GTPase SLIP-GC n=1 Tax=Chaetomium strumarium TaxID=1170767 RepID=A0AAJ0GWN5_9PEZI|nr:hypothetical protein B0T15DRAFT_530475 [Chaetomium strumarium]
MPFVKPESTDDPGSGVSHVAQAPPAPPALSYLQQLASSTSTELLEKGVSIGVRLLDSLKEPLEAVAPLNTTQASQWLKSIGDLEALAKPGRTIVSVVGNTGAGKSSVISAVLDEERLLPTNCMRACTASPTEISYNHSEDPEERYRAEVEFITVDDWVKDLRALYSDLLDGSGEVSREASNQDSDAGIAYAKIKAVYPKFTKEMIANATPEALANQTAVRSILGTVRKLKATTAASLYRQLQEYVDSKEKNTEKRLEYWPLIKVVRIYTKASALATGACLVDLPGVQDSNAARAAVAANYMKACTGLWIVAPITRAVDDKTAKSLLGNSFRRQLKYDGTYSAVTFICSKTDDISVTEAAESLGIEEEIQESWARIAELTDSARRTKSDMADLRDQRDVCDNLIDEIEQTWDKWEALGTKLADGETVYGPSTSAPKKRKWRSKPRGSRKNLASSDFDSDFSDLEGSDSSDKENQESPDEERVPLTADEIDAKLASLKGEKKEVRAKKKQIEEQISAKREDLKALVSEKDDTLAEVKAICIQGRNEYSRKAIKQDFAMGIKELDQENAVEEDEANFDPEVDLRDYDAVAASLPVFCVSSRAFQKLSGRLQKDDFDAGGFHSVDDTEIPQLQAYAKQLTEKGRVANSRRFLNSLMRLLNSMTMWASDDGTRSNLSDAERAREETRLRQRLLKMEQDLDLALKDCVASMSKVFTENIYDSFDAYIPAATAAAVPTATGWGAPRAEGGLLWATYKATCRRLGVYHGASGFRDFNDELFSPISRPLASGWERAFQRRLPSSFDNFLRILRTHLDSFHREATERARERRGGDFTGLAMLSQQLQAHSRLITDLGPAVLGLAQERQREANRAFTPVIQDEMTPAYDGCVNERGLGSYMRMKNIMVNHVSTHCKSMFRTATGVVKNQLEDLLARIQTYMEAQLQAIQSQLARDYLAVLVGSDALSKGLRPPRVELMLRAEMAPMLAKTDEAFAEVFHHHRHHHASEDEATADAERSLTVDEKDGSIVEAKSEEGSETVVGIVKREPGMAA